MAIDLIHRDLEVLNKVLSDLSLTYCSLEIEAEGKEYGACSVVINNKKVLIRTAKITPKKIGQFVTLWKRNSEGITEPHHEEDQFDLVVINLRDNDKIGQFIFSKQSLIDNSIITTSKKEGKRGFRVYPSWVEALNKQAIRTQKKQILNFVDLSNKLSSNKEKLEKLYKLLIL